MNPNHGESRMTQIILISGKSTFTSTCSQCCSFGTLCCVLKAKKNIAKTTTTVVQSLNPLLFCTVIIFIITLSDTTDTNIVYYL